MLSSAASSKPDFTLPLGYRPDIDGLRAVAVILVVLFHADIAPFSGGYIGVDVFFVLSGFLITGLLESDLARGNFSISRFYLRRFRRLLPAFIVVTLSTALFSFHLMLPEDLKIFSVSLVSAWLGISNYFFSAFSGDYFSPRMEYFPLLHTWSLGVEEQFYIVLPAFLYLSYKYFFTQRRAVLTAIFLLLLGFSHLAVSYHPAIAYYWLPFRAFELVLGAIVFLYRGNLQGITGVGANVISLISFLGLLAMAILLDSESFFPGLNAALVAILTASLVCSTSSPASIVGRFLSTKPMVWVGLISYSLYLWHWPVLSLLRYRQVEMHGFVVITAIFACTVFAWLTWRYVENPFRARRDLAFRRTFVTLLVLPVACSVLFSSIVWFGNGLPSRFDVNVRELVGSYSSERDLTRQCSIRPGDVPHFSFDTLEANCKFGQLEAAPSLLLMGDSHANHLKQFWDVLSGASSRSAVYHVQGGCSAVHGLSDRSASDSCAVRNRRLLSMTANVEYVVIASAWDGYPLAGFRENLEASLQLVSYLGAIPIVFKDTPAPAADLSRCPLYVALGWQTRDCRYMMDEVEAVQSDYDAVIDDVVGSFPNAMVVDLKPFLCDSIWCQTSIGNLAVYRDRHHLNDQASRVLGELYLESKGNLISRKEAAQNL